MSLYHQLEFFRYALRIGGGMDVVHEANQEDAEAKEEQKAGELAKQGTVSSLSSHGCSGCNGFPSHRWI